MKNIRRINTRMYGQRAFDILDSVHGQLSDGLWENTPGYDKYWTNFHVRKDVDDRVYFEVSTDSMSQWCKSWIENPYVNMTDKQFLEFIAKKLKRVINVEAKDNNWNNGWWKRNNIGNESHYLDGSLDVAVADIYAVHEELLDRTNMSNLFTGIKERIFGNPASAELIEKRKLLNDKKQKLISEYSQKRNSLTETYNQECAVLKKKYDEEINAIYIWNM